MNDASRRVALRWCLVIVIVHLGAVFAASAAQNLRWGHSSLAWEAGRFLRWVDLPVYWAIDRAIRGITSVPAGWPIGAAWTSVLLEVSAHGLIGGVFYAVATWVTVVLFYRRSPSESRP